MLITATIEEARRAAAESGAEPAYTQAKWRAMLNAALSEVNSVAHRQREADRKFGESHKMAAGITIARHSVWPALVTEQKETTPG